MNGHTNGHANELHVHSGIREKVQQGLKNGPAAHNVNSNIPYGERLIVNILDDLARDHPERIYAHLTNSPSEISKGFHDVTIAQLANAVDYTAWWIDSKIGRSHDFEVLAYMGVADIRYAIMFFAAIKCGYQLMVPSVRNSTSGHLHVLRESKCNKFFHSVVMESKINDLKENHENLQSFVLMSLDELLSTPSKHYPYEKSWSEAWSDPILIAHTSGSTGAPKPITLTNGVYTVWDNMRKIPQIAGRKNQDYSLFDFDGGGRFYSSFPAYHLAGMFALTNVIILFNATVVLGPPNKPPTGELLVQVMQAYKLRAIWCPPTIIEQLLQEPSGLQEAALLDFIMYTGGPLAPFSGDQLSQVTDICQVIGSTETGLQFALVPSRENWRYFEWHPIISNQMEHIGEGVYEMVVRQDHSMAWIRQMSHTLPEADEYRTKDLFVQHPSNPSLWRFHGRRDDIVVLSNGEKFNPVTMEAIVQGHPLVQGALIVGTARFQAALIVEPKKGICLSSVELTNEIWPCIEKANNEGPAHGRITRSKITVATPNKPFVRAAKGTVIRHSTVKLYTTEVEMLYSDPDDNQTQGLAILESQPGLDVLKTFVHTSAVSVLSNSNLDNSDDLFVHGLDSLQTLELTNRLREGVRPHITASQLSIIAPRAVYANPTVDGIAKLLNDFLNPPPLHMEGLTNGDHAKEDRDARMGAIVDKYTKGFPVAREQSQRCTRSSGMITVVLTGSTGSLGTALLEVFLKDPNIAKVYCFNRSANAKLRHQDNFLSRGVQCDLDSKTEFLTVELGHDTFGLDAGKFAEVKENVDVIIHNAWKLDFNHQLQSFEEVHIRGVCKFIDWAIDSPLDPHIFFVSSLASVSQWNSCYGTKDPVPESPLTNYNVSDNLGYGESKHVSERILNFAVERCGIRASILRVGQIAGPVAAHGGEWNRTEWLPILLKTSKTLGRLPNRLSVIDWIPVDKLAQIITDLIHHGFTANKSEIYNLVNPNIAQWSDLVPGICKHWGATKTEIIDFATWINILKATDPDDPDKLITLPALKLLDFFEDLEKSCREPSQPPQTYATDHARDSSQKMCSLEPIDSKAMKIWLNNWQF